MTPATPPPAPGQGPMTDHDAAKAGSDRKIVAQCIADTGYGTDQYDSETNECINYSYYAGVKKVEMNPEYWAQYDSIMSETLWSDFGLPAGFDNYRLKVWSDGIKEYERIDQ